MALVHTFVSTMSDSADATLVRPSNWNDDHTITGQSQGDIIYRSSNDWDRLAIGTAGQFLSVSTASIPAWSDPMGEVISSGTLSGTAVSITGISAKYRGLLLITSSYSFSANNAFGSILVSVTSGSSYPTTGYYNLSAGAAPGTTSIGVSAAFLSSAGYTGQAINYITNYQGGSFPWCMGATSGSTSAGAFFVGIYTSVSAVNAIQIVTGSTTYTFDSGTYTLYGIN